MDKYTVPIQIRWSDIDQNRHLRHSAYYDFGAMARMIFLSGNGLTTAKLEEFKVGPVIFREEALFKREIHLEDRLTIDIEMLKARPDFSRWTLGHHITKEDGTVAAIITIDGAWMDIEKRKLTVPNDFIQGIFRSFPVSAEFEALPEKKA